MSDNPHSGIYEADTARTLDLNGGSPACNQGGMAIVTCPEICSTLPARMDGSPCIDRGPPIIAVYENHGQDSRIKELGDICESVSAKYGTGGNNTPIVLSIGNGQLNQMSMEPVANTLDTMHDQQAVLVCFQNTGQGWWNQGNVAATLRTPSGGDSTKANLIAAVDCRNGTINPDINGTLQAKEQGFNLNSNNVVLIWPEVRRLMPIECERLQNFPDDWSKYGINEKGEVYELSDSARYRLQGNSIARPYWTWLMRRTAAQYERQATVGSLFDGQAGFCLCAVEAGMKPVWSSEIEKNAVAVAKYHFPKD